MALERADKAFRIFVPHLVADILHAQLREHQKLLPLLEPYIGEQAGKGQAGNGLDKLGAVRLREMELLCQATQGDGGTVDNDVIDERGLIL